MRSPALAMAWEFRHRHRWGLIAIGAYLLVIATIKVFVLAGEPVKMESDEMFAFVVMVPLTATFTYCLAVFTFGLDGDLAARQSMYPTRMLALPVSTAGLAGLPMLYGAAVMATLWAAMRLFAVWPSGFEIPVFWPALLAASLISWTQALVWMSYPLPGLRIVVTVLWLGTIDSVALLAIRFNAHEPVMLAILAPQIPLAYVVARFAVARARRGDVPDWRGAFVRARQIADGSVVRKRELGSPARAQTWFEWRQHGRSLPAWVAILIPFELMLLWVAGTSEALVFEIVVGVLVTPVFMATFAAAAVSNANAIGSDSYGVPPFTATRPLTNAELIAAKLKTAIWSTGAAWVLVFVAIPLGLTLSGTSPIVVDRWRRVSEAVGAPRAAVFTLLVVSGCVVSTWKQLVQSLYIGLTGRTWLIKGSVFLTLVLLFLMGPFGQWIVDTRRLSVLWSAIPLILSVLVCLKMSAAAWIGTRLVRGRLLSDRALLAAAACWCVAVFAMYGVLAWLLDAPHAPSYLLLLLAILAVPLARLLAAPLALASNRHR